MTTESTGAQQLCNRQNDFPAVVFVSKSSSVTANFFIFHHFQTVIRAMPKLKPPISLELPENETRVKYILEEANKPDYEFPEVR